MSNIHIEPVRCVRCALRTTAPMAGAYCSECWVWLPKAYTAALMARFFAGLGVNARGLEASLEHALQQTIALARAREDGRVTL